MSSNSSTSPLIAVLLVTSSSRGENLIFSYPKRPHLLKRYSRIRYYATNSSTQDQLEKKGTSSRQARNGNGGEDYGNGDRKGKGKAKKDQDDSNSIDDTNDSQQRYQNNSSKKPRQRSFGVSDGEREGRDRERGGRDKRYHQELEERDRDNQEEDELSSDENELDGLTSSTESESSTDGDFNFDGRDRDRGVNEDSDDEFISMGNINKDRLRRPSFGLDSNDRRSRSKTREGILPSSNRIRSTSRSRTRKAPSTVGDNSEIGGGGNNGSGNRNRRRSSPSTLKSYTQFLGYPIEVLAALLAPRRELCQQKFELIVDDLAFLGHPVAVGKDGTWGEREEREEDDGYGEGGVNEEDDGEDGDEEIEDSEFQRPGKFERNSTFRGRTRETKSSPPNSSDHPDRSNLQPTQPDTHPHVHYDETSEFHLNPQSKSSKGSLDSERARGRADASLEGSQLREQSSNPSKRSKSKSKPKLERTPSSSSLTLFHLVLVLSRPSTNPIGSNSALGSGTTTSTSLNGPDSLSLSSWLQFWYDNVAFKMAAALYAEQCRCDYVRREAEGLIALRERCSEDGASYSSYMTQALASSSLARSLRDLHTSIARSSGAFVSINDTIDAHLQLPPLIHDPVRMLSALDVQTELDGNDPVFLAGEGRPELDLDLNPRGNALGSGLAGDEMGGRNPLDTDVGEESESKILQKIRKYSNSLLPEQFTFVEFTRTTGPFLLPWKTLLILNDRPGAAIIGDSNSNSYSNSEADKSGRGGRRGTTRGRGRKNRREDDGADGESEENDNVEPDADDEAPLPPSGIESWARKFTDLLKPTLSGVPTFAELADLLEWDLYEDVYPMVRHLIYYREARVVDVPRINSTYSISPMLDLEDLPQLSDSWSFTFPTLQSLPSLLSSLSYSLLPFSSHFEISTSRSNSNPYGPSTFSTQFSNSMNAPSSEPKQKPQASSRQDSQSYVHPAQIQRQKQLCLDALIWLLRHEFVAPMKVRLRLVATENVKRRAMELKVGRIEKRKETLDRRKLREDRRLVKIERLRNQALNQAEKVARKEMEKDEGPEQEGERRNSEDNKRGRIRSRSRSNPPPNSPPPLATKSIKRRSNSSYAQDSSTMTGLMSSTRPKTASNNNQSTNSSSTQLSPTTRLHQLGHFSPESKKVESLRFERRPVSRSRSPSMLLEASGLSSLTSASPMTAVSSNGSGGTGGVAGAASGSGSRPVTPRGRGVALHQPTANSIALAVDTRGRSVSSVDIGVGSNNSLPNSAGWSRRGRKSRSPSRARMRIKGFGEGEEITVDEEELEGSTAKLDQGEEETARNAGGTSEISLSPGEERKRAHSLVDEVIPEGLGLTLESASEAHPTSEGQEVALDESEPQVQDTQAEARASLLEQVQENEDPFDEISDFSSSSSNESDEDDFDDEELEDEMNWDFEPSLISEPSRADRDESEWIVAMLDGKEEWLTQRFLRLLPYLNGKHTVDEIVCREELRRRELRAILSQLSEEIITFVHP